MVFLTYIASYMCYEENKQTSFSLVEYCRNNDSITTNNDYYFETYYKSSSIPQHQEKFMKKRDHDFMKTAGLVL